MEIFKSLELFPKNNANDLSGRNVWPRSPSNRYQLAICKIRVHGGFQKLGTTFLYRNERRLKLHGTNVGFKKSRNDSFRMSEAIHYGRRVHLHFPPLKYFDDYEGF